MYDGGHNVHACAVVLWPVAGGQQGIGSKATKQLGNQKTRAPGLRSPLPGQIPGTASRVASPATAARWYDAGRARKWSRADDEGMRVGVGASVGEGAWANRGSTRLGESPTYYGAVYIGVGGLGSSRVGTLVDRTHPIASVCHVPQGRAPRTAGTLREQSRRGAATRPAGRGARNE